MHLDFILTFLAMNPWIELVLLAIRYAHGSRMEARDCLKLGFRIHGVVRPLFFIFPPFNQESILQSQKRKQSTFTSA